jgi:hypothetical protein
MGNLTDHPNYFFFECIIRGIRQIIEQKSGFIDDTFKVCDGAGASVNPTLSSFQGMRAYIRDYTRN